MPYAETLIATRIKDHLYDAALGVADGVSPGSDHVAKVLILSDAQALAHAHNAYPKLIALLERVQCMLAALRQPPDAISDVLTTLDDDIDAAILAHHEFLEG